MKQGANIWTIWTNVSITRRKTYHLVTDPDGRTVWRDRHFWPCVEWLERAGICCYLIRPSEPLRGDRVPSLLVKKEP